jgi:DNA-directed RNA polymerase subunit M/transcription elongation factor TFIIS
MTLTCPKCDCYDIELFNDNGAEYPQTRVEFYECHGCGHEFRKVLTA